MAKTKTITITEDDIRLGVVAGAFDCPVALALKRAFKTSVGVTRSWVVLRAFDDGENLSFRTPRKVAQFIHDFDMDRPVQPFKFRLKIGNPSGGNPLTFTYSKS